MDASRVKVVAPRLGKQADIWAQVAFYSGLGFIIPAGAVIGYAVGWGLDRWLHTAPWAAIVLGFLGAAGGFIEILKILERAEKRGGRNNSGPGTGSS